MYNAQCACRRREEGEERMGGGREEGEERMGGGREEKGRGDACTYAGLSAFSCSFLLKKSSLWLEISSLQS